MPVAYAALRVCAAPRPARRVSEGDDFTTKPRHCGFTRTQIDHSPYSPCVAKKFLRGVLAIAECGLEEGLKIDNSVALILRQSEIRRCVGTMRALRAVASRARTRPWRRV